jgi:hypothetical protein
MVGPYILFSSAKIVLAMPATALKNTKRRFSSLNHQNFELFA